MKANDTERKIADFKVKQQQPYDFNVRTGSTCYISAIPENGLTGLKQ
jgi:hypothetical protein